MVDLAGHTGRHVDQSLVEAITYPLPIFSAFARGRPDGCCGLHSIATDSGDSTTSADGIEYFAGPFSGSVDSSLLDLRDRSRWNGTSGHP